jgi:membrane protease YdiL (CAAX protease family)
MEPIPQSQIVPNPAQNDAKQRHAKTLTALYLFLLFFFTVWSAWAIFLAHHPDLDPHGGLRALVRLAIWVVPVFAFVTFVEGGPVLGRLDLSRNVGRGLAVGLLGFCIPLLFTIVRGGFRGFSPPTVAASWLNPILTAPLAEELLFRGLVFRILRDDFNLFVAFSASAFLFALSHVPYWVMTLPPGALSLNLLSIGAYGILSV